MSLPTTNLTAHFDASVNTDLWTSANPFATHPADTGDTPYWDDVEHVDMALGVTGTNSPPKWRSGTPLMQNACLDFDGSSNVMKFFADDETVGKLLSDLITTSAGTMIFAIYVEGVTSNASASYDNESIIGEDAGNMEVFLKNNSGSYSVNYGNFASGDDHVGLSINLNTSYVVMCRHESGSIYISLNAGAESSTTSGNTAGTGSVFIGKNYASNFFNGRIGEFAIWNAALTGSTLTDALNYFTAKWLPSSTPTPSVTETITTGEVASPNLRSFLNVVE